MVKKILVTGNFNILHPGHLRLLRFAKECGDRLIVAIWSDRVAGQNALLSESTRLECVASNSFVDEVFICDSDISILLDKIRPDVVVKGKEHEFRFNEEHDFLKEYGGKLIFSSGDSTFSSVDLLRKEFTFFNPSNVKLPSEYLLRHEIDKSQIKEILGSFAKMRVLVVGDLIIDEYITCEALGMSQEEPTLVVTPLDVSKFIGGAAIVAAHAAGLGATVSYLGISGNDQNNKFANEKLNEYGVKPYLFIDENRPTTLKQRYRASGKTLLRVSQLRSDSISKDLQDQIYHSVSAEINECDLLVFSDFNYGCLPQDLIERLIKLGLRSKVFMAADCQSSSQIGDILKYSRVNLVTPTEREARISTKSNDSLMVLCNEIAQKLQCKNVLITMAGEGVLIHSPKSDGWHTDQICALNDSPKDTVGAGDSLLITTALSLASGRNIWVSALMGSISAAIQVARVGNTPIKISDFLKEI